ncbi:MAG: hypothetical protein ABI156_02245 [Caldimonas sp.]
MQALPETTPMPVERRFPLQLHKADDDIRALYETAKNAHWNPDSDLPWAASALGGVERAVLDAARRVWSRRAWVEFTGMTETPALLIRFCLELDRESDAKYFLTVRNTEEAWHVESFHRYAEACGGYLERPPAAAWEPVFNRTLYRDALNAEVSIDAYVATHCAFVDGLEYALAQAWLANAREPLAQALLARCVGDYERHARFGWMYARRRAAAMDAALRARVVGALQHHIETVEFGGYHCVALATAVDAMPEVADLGRVAAAGFGAVSADEEVAIFRTCVTQTRERCADIGLALPPIAHPRLGPF